MASNPNRCCDLVMKGGITSGVLYPSAIGEIADRFHLMGIGGTSAGAIAACAAAAAEYRRRRTGERVGYDALERIPGDLSATGRLLGVFRPDYATRDVFKLLLGAISANQKNWLGSKAWKARLAWALLRREKKLAPVVANGFGVCSGMANGNRQEDGEIAPLTEWLADTIDDIAGKTDGVPLTFGDLRRAGVPSILDGKQGTIRRHIDLRCVTTCLSFGQPFELPMDGIKLFAFDPEEWRTLFPSRVVDFMKQAAAEITSETLRGDGRLLPFPVGDKMPVVVAARMSLSFPLLFTLTPLYAVNYHDPAKPMQRVWFSDGGITSNLPVHRFDALFPRWPTLAINLRYTNELGETARRSVDEESLVQLVQRLGDGARSLWHVFDNKGTRVADLAGFGGAIFRSAQVWHDEAYLVLPGYRDRVVEIWLRTDEGGMNLSMPEEVIRRLVERGKKAGRLLAERFATSNPDHPPLSWEGHRWTRFRSGIAGLADYLQAFARSATDPLAGDRTLAELLASPPKLYGFKSSPQHAAAKAAIEELLSWIQSLEADPAWSEAVNHPFFDRPKPGVQIGTRAPM